MESRQLWSGGKSLEKTLNGESREPQHIARAVSVPLSERSLPSSMTTVIASFSLDSKALYIYATQSLKVTLALERRSELRSASSNDSSSGKGRRRRIPCQVPEQFSSDIALLTGAVYFTVPLSYASGYVHLWCWSLPDP